MRALLILGLVATAAFGLTSDAECDTAFARFVSEFGRTYPSGRAKHAARRTFCSNIDEAARLTAAAGPNGAKFSAFTQFADQEPRHKPVRKPAELVPNVPVTTQLLGKAVPQTKDWRSEGAVTAVWNEGQCGSVWSFPPLDNIAALWFLAGKGPLTQLSAQELVSCDSGSDGCNGGLPHTVYETIINSWGGNILTNKSFPYQSGSGSVPPCQHNGTIGAHISGWSYIAKNETLFEEYVGSTAPLSVDINAMPLQMYTGGVLQGKQCGHALQDDHAVTLVGYNNEANPPYWIGKNVWGTTWGEAGYVRFEKGTNCLDVTGYLATHAFVDGQTTPPSPTSMPTPVPKRFSKIKSTLYSDSQCQNTASTTMLEPLKCYTNDLSQGVQFACNSNGNQVVEIVFTGSQCSGQSTTSTFNSGECLTSSFGGSRSFRCEQ